MSQQIEKIRHSLSHILALAVQKLYPGVKFGIGPAIDNGFYYDFQFPEEFSAEELPKVEEKMKELLHQKISFEKESVSKKEAKKIFSGQPFKLELIGELEEDKVSLYKSSGFVDLCKGPHVDSTKQIPIDGFKLDKTAGAYWKGDENNPMLTRIYGLAFEK
jgi:threonyl-tRNA synthetase